MPRPGSDTQTLQSLSDTNLFALTLLAEAGNQPIEGLVAVGCVVRNRLRANRFGHTWKEILLRDWQFSCWEPLGGPDTDQDGQAENYERHMDMARTLAAGNKIIGIQFTEARWVADGIIRDAIRDRVRGATHYCTVALLKSAPPTWAAGRNPVCVIWAHAFFAGVR